MCLNGNNLWLHKPWANALLLIGLWSPWKGFFLGTWCKYQTCATIPRGPPVGNGETKAGADHGPEFHSYPLGSSLKLRIKAN